MLVVVLVGAIAGAVSTSTASAECRSAGHAVFPRGAVVPPYPTLVVAVPHEARDVPLDLTVTGVDGPVPFRLEELAGGPEVRLFMVRPRVARGSLVVATRQGVLGTYQIEPGWRAEAPVIEGVTQVDNRWACSFSRGVIVDVHGAGIVAFRASWPGAPAMMVPAGSADQFLRDYEGAPELDAERAQAFLGHPSCLGDQVPPELALRMDFSLVALYADGSERAVATQTTPVVAGHLAAQGERPRRAWPWWAGAGGAIAFTAAVASWMRRRRRRYASIP